MGQCRSCVHYRRCDDGAMRCWSGVDLSGEPEPVDCAPSPDECADFRDTAEEDCQVCGRCGARLYTVCVDVGRFEMFCPVHADYWLADGSSPYGEVE